MNGVKSLASAKRVSIRSEGRKCTLTRLEVIHQNLDDASEYLVGVFHALRLVAEIFLIAQL